MLGSAVAAELTAAGHQVIRLVRRPPGAGEIRWDPGTGALDPAALDGCDAVVHLSGESILGRWTEAKKRRIRDSRIGSTRLLATALAALAHPPRVLVAASAAGYYGDRGAAVLTEESPPGTGFLAELSREWEAAAAPAAGAGIRVVHLRTSLVLAPPSRGGVLGAMLLPFQFGLGGPIGRGRRYWSWIALDDVAGIVAFAIATTSLRGPINVTAPAPLTNGEFARALGRALGRPAVLPVPPFVLRLRFGAEAARDAMLGSSRVLPAALQAAGYRFRFPDLDGALRHVLGVTR
jgi:uncharacterized protein (TIGR01777 family)